MIRRLGLAVVLALAAACGDDPPAKTVLFGPTDTPETFWDAPWPSDDRLDATGAPDVVAFPNPRNIALLRSLLAGVPERRGWPTMSIAYFRFTAEVPARAITDVISDEAYLLDLATKARYPVVARTLPVDDYVPTNLVALAPRPGIVLAPNTEYAYVVLKTFAPGFTPPSGMDLSRFDNAKDILAATTFTTGDEVMRSRVRSEGVRAAHDVTIDGLALVGGDTHDGFCHLQGTVTLPQFQTGTPPFQTDGLFVLDANGIPTKQGDLTVPIAITIPKGQMPASGWPLYQFFHGSGGLSTGLVDLGYTTTPTGVPEAGKGPGYVVARHGIAAAAMAFPVNPERLPGASDYEYLNISNLHAFPYTYQQGVIEQRLLLDALLAIQIPQATLAPCGTTATGGMHRFDAAKLVAGGQSMGGMYTNMIAAIEPRYGALVPTGAGGFWNEMILKTTSIPGALNLLSTALDVVPEELTFVHPALDAMAMSWEIAEPLVYMNRIAERPLEGFTARHVYEPVGKDDEFFPNEIYDAAALAYGNQQAGDEVWPTMQLALADGGLGGIIAYPVKGNRDGLTRVVVQFAGDGILDSHQLYRQNEMVKHQYGCFFATFLRDGVPTVPAPAPLLTPCP